MSNQVLTIVIVGALCGAIGFALGRNGGPLDAKAQPHVELPVADGQGAPLQGALPPNHPPVGDTMAPHAPAASPSDRKSVV